MNQKSSLIQICPASADVKQCQSCLSGVGIEGASDKVDFDPFKVSSLTILFEPLMMKKEASYASTSEPAFRRVPHR